MLTLIGKDRRMRVFFDFNKFDHKAIDGSLCDILFAIKNELINHLSPLKDEMDQTEGFILIALNTTYPDGVYFYCAEEFKKKLYEAVKDFDYQSVVKKYRGTTLN